MTKSDEITKLAERLEDGYARIDEAQRQGNYGDFAKWESFWMKLLKEYELLCDELDGTTAAREQAALL